MIHRSSSIENCIGMYGFGPFGVAANPMYPQFASMQCGNTAGLGFKVAGKSCVSDRLSGEASRQR